MEHWENLHFVIRWDGLGRQALAVYMNGCKVDPLCGAAKCRITEYLHDLKSQGWEKFGHEHAAPGLPETYYFQRLMTEARQIAEPQASLPQPQFVHHRM